jgi:hypothetical protein
MLSQSGLAHQILVKNDPALAEKLVQALPNNAAA